MLHIFLSKCVLLGGVYGDAEVEIKWSNTVRVVVVLEKICAEVA